MMPSEIVTSVQEGIKIVIVLVDNHGFASIGSLSRRWARKVSAPATRPLREIRPVDGERLMVDYAANARSLGAYALKANTRRVEGSPR